MAAKYDPEEFIKSEEKEQPSRRQHYSDDTDLAIQQAKLDALKNREDVGAQAFLGRKVDEIVSKLREGRDPSQQIGSTSNRQNYI
tara:strand:- start:429 stop:683 length:255 start_codon:yes stop_codon:yes gene_type:complete